MLFAVAFGVALFLGRLLLNVGGLLVAHEAKIVVFAFFACKSFANYQRIALVA
jgi:hypothetical protein